MDLPELTKEEAREYAIGLAIAQLTHQLDIHPFGPIKRAAVEDFILELKEMQNGKNES